MDHVRCAGDRPHAQQQPRRSACKSNSPIPAAPSRRVRTSESRRRSPWNLPPPAGRGVAESDCGSSESGESGSAGDRSVRVRVGRWGWPLAWMASVAAPGLSSESVPVGPAGPGVSARPGPAARAWPMMAPVATASGIQCVDDCDLGAAVASLSQVAGRFLMMTQLRSGHAGPCQWETTQPHRKERRGSL